jgi:hypothetical protein
VLKSVLHEPEAGVVFIQYLAPSFHADGEIGAAIDKPAVGVGA